jgi:hypothetical protein
MTMTGRDNERMSGPSRPDYAMNAPSPERLSTSALDDRYFAVHEAGHAVAALSVGGWVKRVYLHPREQGGGQCLPVIPDECMAIVGFAGDAATQIELGVTTGSGIGDFSTIVKWADRKGVSGERVVADHLEALELMRRELPAVRAVAAALQERRTLDGETVARLRIEALATADSVSSRA